MSTITEATEVALNRINDNWAARTELTFENEEFNPTPDTSWARVSVIPTVSRQDSIGAVGAREFRRRGMVAIQIFCPANEGSKEADGHVQRVREIFEGVTDTGVEFMDVQHRKLGVIDEGRWYGVIAEAEFAYHERR